MEELKFLNALNRISQLGPVRMKQVLNHFGSAQKAWEASETEWAGIKEIQNIAPRLARERAAIDPEREWLRLRELGFDLCSFDSPAYPPLLKNISRPPPLLYTSGHRQEWDQPALAIVGSRRCTFYGQEVAAQLARELAGLGFIIVSGLALGIDTQAHRGTLQVNGRTVAVLGCGLNKNYPPGNRDLRDQILCSGMVISEFPLDTNPLPQNFPQRNRIISGISLGTVVVEASEKSGALITANYALEQNREVFAVPGNIGSPYSHGCHLLIKEGAKLVESVTDILEELAVEPVSQEKVEETTRVELTPAESRLLELLPYQPLHIDDILRLSDLKAEDIWACLLNLELKGYLRQLAGKYFTRV